jgi:hypothetical protein
MHEAITAPFAFCSFAVNHLLSPDFESGVFWEEAGTLYFRGSMYNSLEPHYWNMTIEEGYRLMGLLAARFGESDEKVNWREDGF